MCVKLFESISLRVKTLWSWWHFPWRKLCGDMSKAFRFEQCHLAPGGHQTTARAYVSGTLSPHFPIQCVHLLKPCPAHICGLIPCKPSHSNTRAERKQGRTEIMPTAFPSAQELRSQSGRDPVQLVVYAEWHTQANRPRPVGQAQRAAWPCACLPDWPAWWPLGGLWPALSQGPCGFFCQVRACCSVAFSECLTLVSQGSLLYGHPCETHLSGIRAPAQTD
jgi:hypothetical protein